MVVSYIRDIRNYTAISLRNFNSANWDLIKERNLLAIWLCICVIKDNVIGIVISQALELTISLLLTLCLHLYIITMISYMCLWYTVNWHFLWKIFSFKKFMLKNIHWFLYTRKFIAWKLKCILIKLSLDLWKLSF